MTRLVERDAADVVELRRLGDLPLVLRLSAARNSEGLNVADLCSQTGAPSTSLTRMIDLLETLYLVQRIPAGSTNLSKRVVSRPKLALLDSGVAVRLVNASAAAAAPGMTGEIAGHLLEGFVAGELRKQLGWTDELVRISHYRDRSAGEVDLILESDDERVAGIELKAAATVTAADTHWLTVLADRLGSRFVGGVVLYSGPTTVPFGDRVVAAPWMSCGRADLDHSRWVVGETGGLPDELLSSVQPALVAKLGQLPAASAAVRHHVPAVDVRQARPLSGPSGEHSGEPGNKPKRRPTGFI